MEKIKIWESKSNLPKWTNVSQPLSETLQMNLSKAIQVYKETFQSLENLWKESKEWKEYSPILDSFLDEIWIKQKNETTRYVAYERVAQLKENALKNYLSQAKQEVWENTKDLKVELPSSLDEKIILQKAYQFVKRLYTQKFDEFIQNLEEKNILDNFHLELIKSTFLIWEAFNEFFPKWIEHIEKQNDILDKKFSNDGEKIMKYLEEKDLLEKDENWDLTDRSYTVLVGGKMLSYAQAFPNEIRNISNNIEQAINNLSQYENNEKQAIINYLTAIKEAYEETDTTKLLSKWQKVDELWMQVSWPIQIVHPMEYYEDKYRKAVTPEFDVRILDTKTLQSDVIKDISTMFEILSEKHWKEKYLQAYNYSKESFSRVLLFISEPVVYSGWYLNWLFSAQVVPNDENATKKYWKKIFAFPNKVLAQARKTPEKKHTQMTVDSKIVEKYRQILEDSETYFKIYDIDTIWHEFGHTLWLGENAEVEMNKTGNFKNIEEFKATTWWLVAYFVNEDEIDLEFVEKMLILHTRRVVNLQQWKKITEVLPYYNEWLIHLDILYNSWIIKIEDNKVIWNFSEQTYKKLKELYLEVYNDLIETYLNKKDASEFLYKYAESQEDGTTLPKNPILKDFALYYFDMFEKYGNEVVKD